MQWPVEIASPSWESTGLGAHCAGHNGINQRTDAEDLHLALLFPLRGAGATRAKRQRFLEESRPKAVRPKAVRPKAVRPKAVRPKAVRSKAVRPKPVRSKAVRPKAEATAPNYCPGTNDFGTLHS